MQTQQAKDLVREIFENQFDKEKFDYFIKNLLNHVEVARTPYKGNFIPDAFKPYIKTLERIYKYYEGRNNIDVLVITFKKETSLERARTMQRNFVAWYLNGSRGGKLKDAALVAYISPANEDWRFSLVKMDYKFDNNGKVREQFTPARRWSFLVGKNENSHTAQSRFVDKLEDDDHGPNLKELEEAFNIETVTNEFFEKYRDLFIRTKEELDKILKKDSKVKKKFKDKNLDTVNFAKKLLGQIVFLYFLQKKGWFGVGKDDNWGDGSKNFLRELFEKKHAQYKNFFNDILEPLFYEALRRDRSSDDNYYSRFNCKIPFLNGGLFDPIGDYNWVSTDITIPNNLFSNKNTTKEGDIGDGILDVFDRYNFTVKEDEPLEKEVAVDPELLGKAYEKFIAIRPDNFEEFKNALRKSSKSEENKFNKKYGVYYTPREIVHYMCKQSLLNYLYTEINSLSKVYENIGDDQLKIYGNDEKVGQLDLNKENTDELITKDDLEKLIDLAELIPENERQYLNKKTNIEKGAQKYTKYKSALPNTIYKNAEIIDEKLKEITVCDPAVGSGAFLVGMLNEIVRVRKLLYDITKNNNVAYYDLKSNSIEKSLYGVDIDSGAVEIAKLRLWLSLIVDEQSIENIKPLPNLYFKVIRGDSLIEVEKDLFNSSLLEKIKKLKSEFFNETDPEKKKNLKEEITNLIIKVTKGHKEFDFEAYFSEIFNNDNPGFDIVIANPPYVSTKGTNETDKKTLKKFYGFADDLYSHFYFKADRIARQHKGIVTFISSKTFWTIQTKRNLRALLLQKQIIEIFDTANPFEAMVDTCVLIFQKIKDYSDITTKDGKNNLFEPIIYKAEKSKYLNAVNNVFFIPNKLNKAIYNKYNHQVKKLMDKWWEKIRTSGDIEKNKNKLNDYRKKLKPGDITLLGLITDGGQGLATSNNGKYIGVLEDTKYAFNIIDSRPKKLLAAINSNNIKELKNIKTLQDAKEFLSKKTEGEIRDLFDKLKLKYGRDIFGKGFVYRIVSKNEIADVNKLTNEEKKHGIKGKKTFVPYDKGDKEGNRWFLKTPFYIDWKKDNINTLKKDPNARWQGYEFYFKEGVCWIFTLNENSQYQKARIKTAGVFDVNAMSLFPMIEQCSAKYIVTLLNSYLLYHYKFNFINNTSGFQINDARQIPIIIPSKKQLNSFEKVFNDAYSIKQKQFNNQIEQIEAEKKLTEIQNKVDEMVYNLYKINPD